MLRIRVSTASAEIAETELITAGRRGLKCSFEFNAAWTELAKTVIVSGAVSRDIVLVGDTITVPGECVAKENFPLKIGVYGANGDGDIVIPTIWTNFGKILPAAKPTDIKPDEITPNVVAQIQKNSSDALAFARSVVERADAGEFDGRDGVDGEKGDPGPDNVFTAIFGETTGEEICQAYAARKICQLRYPYLTTSNEKVYRLTWCGQYTIIRTGGTTVEWAAVFSQNRNNELTTVEVVGSSWEAPRTLSFAEVRSPLFSGTPRAPTADAGTNTSQIATTAFVQQEISSKYVKPSDGIPATDLASDVQASLGKADTALQAETDPTVPAWAKAANKPSYTAPEVGALPASTPIPEKVSDLTNDSGFVNAAGAAAAAPVQSVNGKNGAVSLTAADVGAGTYSKPSGGIPKTDLANDVQTSLGKADTALQEHQSLAAYRTAADQDVIDASLDNTFCAIYRETTHSEVQDAINAKKSCIVYVNGTTYVYYFGKFTIDRVPPFESAYHFYRAETSGIYEIQLNSGESDPALAWSDPVFTPYPVAPRASTAVPFMDGAGSPGTDVYYARADHVHPSDSSKLSTTGDAYRAASIPMGKLDSTSTATVMTATVPGITELRDGVCMWLKNGVITSAANFTININGLGAKPCYSSLAAATRVTTAFNVNYTMLMVYNSTRVDGGCWDIVYGVDSNTTYNPYSLGFGYGTCTTAAATAAKAASVSSSYKLVAGGIVAIKFSYDVPAGATLNINSKGAKAIYYKGAAIGADVIKAGDTVTMVYSTYYHVLSIDRDVDTLPPSPSDDNPMMDNAASPGSSTDYARADHVHPSDSSKIGKEDGAIFANMFANGSSVTCTMGYANIYGLFASQQKTYFVLVKSQTDVQVFTIDRVDVGNQTIYLSSIVAGVLYQIVLLPLSDNTMTGTLDTIDLNLQSAQGVSF